MDIMGFIALMKTFRVVRTDANGNLPANVRPRMDTMANLLAITTAGNGEIAHATDVPGVGVLYRRDTTRSYGLPIALGNGYPLQGEFSIGLTEDISSFATHRINFSAVGNQRGGMSVDSNGDIDMPDWLQYIEHPSTADLTIRVRNELSLKVVSDPFDADTLTTFIGLRALRADESSFFPLTGAVWQLKSDATTGEWDNVTVDNNTPNQPPIPIMRRFGITKAFFNDFAKFGVGMASSQTRTPDIEAGGMLALFMEFNDTHDWSQY